MSVDLQWMEHRWGTRVALDAQAEIVTPDGMAGTATVRNASLSGALIETACRAPLLGRLSLRPGVHGGEWLEGCVVRREGHSVAIEWLDPPLHAVARLLSLQHGTPAADGAKDDRAASNIVSLKAWQQTQV